MHVGHFLPWARHPNDTLANLVAADARCNGDKRDFLAGDELLARWRRRLAEPAELAQVARDARWELVAERALGAARSLYLPLPVGTRLWAGRGRFVEVAAERVRVALG